MWFMRNYYGVVKCYADGSCLNNGYDNASGGIGVFFGNNHEMNVSMPLDWNYRQTNNTAEIHAAKEACIMAMDYGIYELEIHSDSNFMISGITDWIETWRYNGWVTTNGNKVINKEDFLELESVMDEMNEVNFVFVPGHSNSWGNKQADRLAREAAKYR